MPGGGRVQRLYALPPGFDSLVQQSQAEGFRFLQRMRDEWVAGSNRFCGAGEALFAAFDAATAVGVCGLNAGPYSRSPEASRVGRVRHLYVSPTYRCRGHASALLRAVISLAIVVVALSDVWP